MDTGITHAPETTELPLAERPNGPAMAAIVAAGIGSLILGVFTTAAEASASLKSWLAWNGGVGPLSGKTGIAMAAWVGSWMALGFMWRHKEINVRAIVIVAAVLIGLGILGTFPSLFEQFTVE